MINFSLLRTAFSLLALLMAFSPVANAALNRASQVPTRADSSASFPLVYKSTYSLPVKSHIAPAILDTLLPLSSTTRSTPRNRATTRLIQWDPAQQELERRLEEAKRLAEEAKKREEELKKLEEEARRREDETKRQEEESKKRLEEAKELAQESQRRLDAIKQAQLEADPDYREQKAREAREAAEAVRRAEARREAEREALLAKIEQTFLAPPVGNYICSYIHYDVDEGMRVESKGFFSLQADGTYRWLGRGAAGHYRYDAAKKEIKFLNGPLAYPGLIAKFDNRGVRGVSSKPILIFTFQTAATLAKKAMPVEWLCEWREE